MKGSGGASPTQMGKEAIVPIATLSRLCAGEHASASLLFQAGESRIARRIRARNDESGSIHRFALGPPRLLKPLLNQPQVEGRGKCPPNPPGGGPPWTADHHRCQRAGTDGTVRVEQRD